MPYYRRIEGVAFKGHHVPETKGIQDVLDSGFHYLNSGIQVMGSGSLSVELGFPIPIIWGIPDSKPQDSGLHKQKFPEFPFMARTAPSGPDGKNFVPKTVFKKWHFGFSHKIPSFYRGQQPQPIWTCNLNSSDLLYKVFYDFCRISIDIFLDQ